MEVVVGPAGAVPLFFVVSVTVMPAPASTVEAALKLEMIMSGRAVRSNAIP